MAARAPLRTIPDPILEGIMLNHEPQNYEPQNPDGDATRLGDPGAHHALSPRSAGAQSPVPRIATIDRGLSQVRSVIEGLPEPILLTDADDRIQLTNPSADDLFSDRPVRDREDLMSRFEPFDASEIAGESEDPPDDPVFLKLRDDPMRSFAIETFPLDRPDPTHQGVNRQGSVFVLRGARTPRESRPEADAFLAIMSHELRTPITTIYAGSSVLAHSAHLSRPVSHTLALDISAEAARLYDLVEDLIAIARLERRALDPLDEPVLLQRVADATARIVASRAPDVVFIRDGTADPPPVRGDATYVEQAARNLALAASRFGGPGRPVTLRLDDHGDESEVVFRVLDRGPDLSPDERAHAFDLPDESGTGRLGAAGIGPYVARSLIEAMGGRVWALNRSDGGVELGFGLPVDEG